MIFSSNSEQIYGIENSFEYHAKVSFRLYARYKRFIMLKVIFLI
ncbi:hypothetical protein Xedl_02740 [Xenorhabdus eapokensis]|uniref:Uncharacterized protein n=1 Tax=Xenorhabdus eapokensis TaxID=1873482 RepID=A0A1Q5TNE8_9GAMM|nr:hypothetical protein Xedl_02740 [Xenorhabdus eapokensis]